jgi:chromosome segregation ATPase
MRTNSEISQLRLQLQELRQSAKALSDEERTTIVADLEKRAADLEQQILELDSQCDSLGQEYQDGKADLSPLNSQLQKLDNQLYNLDQRRSRRTAETERINDELRRREDEYEHIMLQTKEFRKNAKAIGAQPTTVRMPPAVREEQIQLQAMINTITATAADQQAFTDQEQVVTQLHQYLKDRKLHLENLMTDVDRRLIKWREELETTIETLNHRMNQLLSHFLKQVKLIVRYPDEPSRAELHLQLAINRRGQWRTYQEMSGGERVLATQTFILALHTLAKSPLHVIDEFTQRLDEASRAAVLSVVQRTLDLTSTTTPIHPQFLLMAPSTVGLQIPETMQHVILLKGQVKSS